MPYRCLVRNCATAASFGPSGAGQRGAVYCGRHCPPGYQNVIAKRCIALPPHVPPSALQSKCSRVASFGPPGASPQGATSCAQHQLLGYQNVRAGSCAAGGCAKRPTHGLPSETRATHCSEHRPDGSRPFFKEGRAGRCEAGGCWKTASFGPPGARRGTRCARHRLDGQCNLRAKRCVFCKTIPSYAPPGGSRGDASHCVRHYPSGYLDVVTRLCEVPGCAKSASYGMPVGEQIGKQGAVSRFGATMRAPTRCVEHRLDGQTSHYHIKLAELAKLT